VAVAEKCCSGWHAICYLHVAVDQGISTNTQHHGWLAGWKIDVPFQHKKGYIKDKVLGGDLVLPGEGWPTIQ